MLTPRHQALLMTLAGMTVGVAVFGAVLVINGGNPLAGRDETPVGVVNSQPTPSGTPHGDGLQAGSLSYVEASFGTDDKPVSAEVPAGWRSSQDGTRPRFLDPTGVWTIRFDTRGSKQTPDELVAARARSIDERDFKELSSDNGTLVYTYVDQSRGPRMGLSKWISADGGRTSAVEITVGGRPQDEQALRDILRHATDTLKLPTDDGDTRPN